MTLPVATVTTPALMLAVLLVLMCLLFAMWIVWYTKDIGALREAGHYLTKIPLPFRRRPRDDE
jgi:hypothetical protein